MVKYYVVRVFHIKQFFNCFDADRIDDVDDVFCVFDIFVIINPKCISVLPCFDLYYVLEA